MSNSGGYLHILAQIGDYAEVSGQRDLLKALSMTCKYLSECFFHSACQVFDLRTSVKRSTFLKLVELGIASPSKILGIRIDLSDTDSSIPAVDVLPLFLFSKALASIELYGKESDEIFSQGLPALVSRIASTVGHRINFTFTKMPIVPWVFMPFARQVILQESALLSPGCRDASQMCDLPLETISFIPDTGALSLEVLAKQGVRVPQLTHLLLHFRPSYWERDEDMVYWDLTKILQTSDVIEEITIIYRSNDKMSLSDVGSEVVALVQKLLPITPLGSRTVTLNLHFECLVEHTFQILPFLENLLDFKLVSIAVRASQEDADRLLRIGYQQFVASGDNTSFRVDRIIKDERLDHYIIQGRTAKDEVTRSLPSRERSHYNVCGPLTRPELGKSLVEWHDSLVPIETLGFR